jgi:hypothetical protein
VKSIGIPTIPGDWCERNPNEMIKQAWELVEKAQEPVRAAQSVLEQAWAQYDACVKAVTE